MNGNYIVSRILGSARHFALFVMVLLSFFAVGIGIAYAFARHNDQATLVPGQPTLPATGDEGQLGQLSQKLTVNAQLQVNGEFYLAPSSLPANPKAGTLVFDQVTSTLQYFNGADFIPLTAQSGAPQGGVSSLQGQTGAVTLTQGSGISINGTIIANSGILGVNGVAGDINVTTANGIATLSLPQSIAPTASPVFAGLTLGSALPVGSGGTGASSLTANGVLVGNGGGAITSVTAGAAGQCLVSTAGAPAFGACSGGAAVTSLNSLTGALTLANASGVGTTITIDDATTAAKGIASFNSTNFTVTAGAVNTIQNIATTSSPTFAGLTLSSPLTVGNGGTGATTAAGARGNLGAAASGANSDITSTTALNTITPSGALTIGATGQSFTLQGSGTSTLTATTAGNTTTVGFTSPTANTTLNFPALSAGTYSLCTSSGNCAGAGGGVTTPGGTSGAIAKFTGSQTLGDSIISESGSTITVAGSAVVQSASGLTLGTASGNNGQLVLRNSTNSNTLTLQSGATGSNLTFTLPISDGASGQCLKTNASGVLSFGDCLSGGAGSGVTTLNTFSGAVTLQGTANQIIVDNTAGTITLSTPQDINTSSSPTFNGLTLSTLSVSGSVTFDGNLTVGNASTDRLTITSQLLGASPLVFQGATDNGFETTFAITDPTADRTITFADETGTVCTTAASAACLTAYSGVSKWTDGGTATYLTATGDELVVGSTSQTLAAKLAVVGTANQEQFLIRAATGQTDPLIVLQEDGGTEIARIDADDGGNVGFGALVLSGITSGGSNVAFGSSALYTNTTGAANVAIGQNALQFADGGNYNIGIGAGSLSGTTGSNNIAIGRLAGDGITSGNNNIVIGDNQDVTSPASANQLNIAGILTSSDYTTGNLVLQGDNAADTPSLTVGTSDQDGSIRIADGTTHYGTIVVAALGSDETYILPDSDGSDTVCLLDLANCAGSGSKWTDGGTATYLTATGDELVVGSTSQTLAAKLAVVGTSNQTQLLVRAHSGQTIANPLVLFQSDTGTEWARLSADASGNLLFGNNAMGTAQSGNSDNIAFGTNSLDALTSGDYNIALGSGSLTTNTTGEDNIALGRFALQDSTTGSTSIAIGRFALSTNASGGGNIAIGEYASVNSEGGTGNVAVGGATLQANEGNDNVALGSYALQDNVSGSNNIAIGRQTLDENGTGSENIAIGYLTLANSEGGARNIALGTQALTGNASGGDDNIAIGSNAGNSVDGGDHNILLGYWAGENITTGNRNIILGYDLDASSTTVSDELRIGSGSNILLHGDMANRRLLVGSGTTTSTARLTVTNESTADAIVSIRDDTTEVMGIADGGAATFRNSTNSTAGFAVQNVAGANIVRVDTMDSNLVINPGAEVTFGSEWAAHGASVTVARETTNKWSGLASVSVVTPASTNRGVQNNLGAALSTSTAYFISFYAKLGSGTFTDITVVYDRDGAGAGAETTCGSYNTQTIVTSGWTRVTCSLTTSASAGDANAFLAIRQAAATARTFYVDGVQLETTAVTGYGAGALQVDALVTAPLFLQNTENSTTSLVVNQASGTTVLNVDTQNSYVGIGTAANLGAKLSIVNSANEEALLIRAHSAQTDDNPLILLQSSTGTEIARLTAISSNLFFGNAAGGIVQSGNINNVGIGSNSLDALTGGDDNIAIGVNSLTALTTGAGNIAIGTNALEDNQTISNNIAIGYDALANITAGGSNVAVGDKALFVGTNVQDSVAVGTDALRNNTDGWNLTAVGHQALLNATGDHNQAFGYSAGSNITTGVNNLMIGYDVDASASGASTGNEFRLGYSTNIMMQGDLSTSALTFNGNLTFGNATSDTITFTGRVNSAIEPDAASTRDFGSTTLEWDDIFVGDGNGLNLGLDQDAELAYDEATDDRVELTGTGASLFIEDKLGFGRQTFTMSTAGAATENLTVSASYIEISGQDNAADIAAVQTTNAKEGDMIIITNTSSTDVSIDQNATTKLSGGADVLLTQYDVITLIFDGANWLQVAAVTNNS